MSLIRNTIMECQVCGEWESRGGLHMALLCCSPVALASPSNHLTGDLWVALTVPASQASMNSVPTAAPTPAFEVWTAWKCMNILATAVGPVPQAFRATAPTVMTSMRWGKAEPTWVQIIGVRVSEGTQEAGKLLIGSRGIWGSGEGRDQQKREIGGRQKTGGPHGRSWGSGRAV